MSKRRSLRLALAAGEFKGTGAAIVGCVHRGRSGSVLAPLGQALLFPLARADGELNPYKTAG